MLDARFSHLYFYQSLNRLQRGLSAIAELLVKLSESSGMLQRACAFDVAIFDLVPVCIYYVITFKFWKIR